jgi:excisionase family DNA binding protein
MDTALTLTVEEAEQVSGYCQEWIRRLIREGTITAQKIGRMWFLDKKSLEDYMARHER